MLSKVWSINTPFYNVVLYYFLSSPGIIIQMIPVSILLATLMLFSYLNKNNELIALVASGRSLLQISSPVIFVVIVISIVSFLFSDYILPISNYQSEKVWAVNIKEQDESRFYRDFYQKKTWFRSNNAIYNIENYDAEENKMYGINVYLFDDNFNLKEHSYGKVGEPLPNGIWQLKSVRSTTFSKDKINTIILKTKDFMLGETDLSQIESKSNYLDTNQLRSYVKDLESVGLHPAKYKVEYHKRYSMAFAGLIMCMLGIPFAIRQHRKGGIAVSIGIGFMLVFVYWIFFSIMLSLGFSARINAFLSAWLANILFFVFALFMLRKVTR